LRVGKVRPFEAEIAGREAATFKTETRVEFFSSFPGGFIAMWTAIAAG